MESHGTVDCLPETEVTWKILSVEDDISYQSALVNGLKTLDYGNKKVEFLTANSAQEAGSLLAQNPDIGMILLDVVMETDDAGLRLVQSIREGIGNQLVRIVLLTGQPGMMPLDDLMSTYDIDDYWNKSELTQDHLQTIVLSNLRTWEHLSVIQKARHGMQLLIESSQRISSKYDLKSYTQAILHEVVKLFDFEKGGIVCMAHQHEDVPDKALVFAAAGEFQSWANQYIGSIEVDEYTLQMLKKSFSTEKHVFGSPISVLYFSGEDIDQRDYAVLVKHHSALQDYQIEMLKVFCENVSLGFKNVALHGRLAELAYYDTITGLHNKNWLLRQLAGLSAIERKNSKLLMLFVEDMSYSEVMFGVQFGRSLMKHLHAHLKACFVRSVDIALYERDTLILLVYDRQDYTREDLEHVLHPRLQIDDSLHVIDLMGSLVKLSDVEDKTPAQILGVAKSTLEYAKHDNVDFGVFSQSQLQLHQQRYTLLKALREAIPTDKLFIHLQPKIRLQDDQVIGYEVLARWQHKDGSMIPPDQFIKMAETSGLIDRLDRRITRLACRAAKALESNGIVNVSLSVNVSGAEISRPDYVDNFLDLLREEQVEPSKIDIEVTETQLMNERKAIMEHLKRFKALAIRVSIDDFGAGYSSLAYLSTLNTEVLKIDRQFIARMLDTKEDLQVVKMIIDLGHTLNMEVLAEGIETKEQYEQLKSLGCDTGQGYYMAKPMQLDEVLTWHHSPHQWGS